MAFYEVRYVRRIAVWDSVAVGASCSDTKIKFQVYNLHQNVSDVTMFCPKKGPTLPRFAVYKPLFAF